MFCGIPHRFSSSDPEIVDGSSRSFSWFDTSFDPSASLGQAELRTAHHDAERTRSKKTHCIFALFFLLLACASEEQRPLPDLLSLDQTLGFTSLPVSDREHSLLQSIHPEHSFQSAVLLKDGERQAAVFYVDTLHAAEEFRRLKVHVYQIASAEFTDLTDERMERKGFRSVDLFAFTDPSLLDERFLFARIENTLYEFHVQEGKEGWVQGVLTALAEL